MTTAHTIDLGELLASVAQSSSSENPHNAPKPIEEAQVAELQHLCEVFQKGNTFKVGDLVTPRKCSGLMNAGLPHIVVEVFDEPVRRTTEDNVGSPHHLALQHFRVMAYGNGNVICCWAGEPWMYEPYEL